MVRACGALLVGAIFPAGMLAQDRTVLVVTGSSMPAALYEKWNEEYSKLNPKVEIRYLAHGSGESATLVLAGSGDFGGGDAPIPESRLKSATEPIFELPTVMIGIVIVYNLPDVPGELHLSGPALANIFLGKITSWHDPALARLNPDMKLPSLPIEVLHRTEGKGSSYILTDFLAKVSPEFLARAGRSESPKWPVGTAVALSHDLDERVRTTPGAIGYTELNLALRSNLRIAAIQNSAGEFVTPSVAGIVQAATAARISSDFRVSLTNAPGKDTYPISSFTWFYVPAAAKDPQRGQIVCDYLKWAFTDGQKIAEEQGYAPLPDQVLAKVQAKAATVR